MKKIASLALILLVVFSACQKDGSSPSQNTIVVDIDGKTTTFNNTVIGLKVNTSGVTVITFTGMNTSDVKSDKIAIGVGGPKTLTTGSLIFDPPAGDNSAVISYVVEEGAHGYGPADLGGPDPIVVTINSLSDTNIQGTFSGTLALDDSSSPTHKVLTNGKFNVNYH